MQRAAQRLVLRSAQPAAALGCLQLSPEIVWGAADTGALRQQGGKSAPAPRVHAAQLGTLGTPQTSQYLGVPRHLHLPTPWSLISQRHLSAPTSQPQGTAPGQDSQAAPTDSVWTAPNLLSVARAVSAPFISYLILTEHWQWALVATAVSGATDWADGALARHLGQTSIIGSYLDPLADKVLVACVVGALAYGGHAPMWLAALVVGRDVGLVGGMALHRWRALGWRVRGLSASEFFQTGASAGVPLMKPLLISKANTVLQLVLVCGCMTHAWLHEPDASMLHQLEMVTAATTGLSLAAYAWQYASGKLLPMPPSQSD